MKDEATADNAWKLPLTITIKYAKFSVANPKIK